MMKYLCIFLIIVVAVLSSCETMEDTYADYLGEGKIRYVGKCKNPEIKPGWRRFQLSWENSVDATIDKIKIVWKSDELKDSVLIDGGLTTYVTDTVFGNRNYEFQLYAMDKEGNQSLKTSVFGKPFTHDHELLYAYGSFEKSHFYLNNSLLLILSELDEAVLGSRLFYYKNDVKKSLELSEADYSQKYLVFDDIDPESVVQLDGFIKIDECFDTIHIEPYSLPRDEKLLHSDFRNHLQLTYNIEGDIDDQFIDNLDTLYLDYDLMSLEDVLYFNNLRHIVIGGNRFTHPDYPNDKPSNLDDRESSLFALQQYYEKKEVTIEIYNNHYNIAADLPFAILSGNPVLPTLTFFDMSAWTITCSSDVEGYNSKPGDILDNDVNTAWRPVPVSGTQREHELVIDMKESKQLNGLLISQPASKVYYYNQDYYTNRVRILISEDGHQWNNPLLQKSWPLGIGKGESTLIELPETETARYIKIIVNDVVGSMKYTYLADCIPF